jgi:Haem-binding domain
MGGGKTLPRKIIVTSSILALLIAIQFIQVDRSNPPIKDNVLIPPAVSEVLHKSCFDCHSNETNWPWYSNIAPVSWMLSHHVQEGRDHLNFSTWNETSGEKQTEIVKEVWEEVSEGKMPLGSYLLLHPKAKLSDAEKEELRIWSKLPRE